MLLLVAPRAYLENLFMETDEGICLILITKLNSPVDLRIC